MNKDILDPRSFMVFGEELKLVLLNNMIEPIAKMIIDVKNWKNSYIDK